MSYESEFDRTMADLIEQQKKRRTDAVNSRQAYLAEAGRERQAQLAVAQAEFEHTSAAAYRASQVLSESAVECRTIYCGTGRRGRWIQSSIEVSTWEFTAGWPVAWQSRCTGNRVNRDGITEETFYAYTLLLLGKSGRLATVDAADLPHRLGGDSKSAVAIIRQRLDESKHLRTYELAEPILEEYGVQSKSFGFPPNRPRSSFESGDLGRGQRTLGDEGWIRTVLAELVVRERSKRPRL